MAPQKIVQETSSLPKRRIGVFGGTFDPIHIGHIDFACKCRDALALNTLILVPTGGSFWKLPQMRATAQQRLEMCQMAVDDVLGLEVSDVETFKTEQIFMANTLKDLQKKYLNTEIFLLMGNDVASSLLKWYDWEYLRDNTTVVVAERCKQNVSYRLKLTDAGIRWMHLDFTAAPISSTDIRSKLAAGEDVSDLINSKVYRYIQKHKLYT